MSETTSSSVQNDNHLPITEQSSEQNDSSIASSLIAENLNHQNDVESNTIHDTVIESSSTISNNNTQNDDSDNRHDQGQGNDTFVPSVSSSTIGGATAAVEAAVLPADITQTSPLPTGTSSSSSSITSSVPTAEEIAKGIFYFIFIHSFTYLFIHSFFFVKKNPHTSYINVRFVAHDFRFVRHSSYSFII